LEAVELSMPGRLDSWVMHFDVAVVTDMEGGVPYPPGQFDAFVCVPEWFRPTPCKLEGLPANGNRPLPDVHSRAAASGVADAYAWDPATRRLETFGIDNAWLDHAETRVCSELPSHPSQDVVFGQAGIIVEEEQQLPCNQGHACVTARRNPSVLW
jgi:hypothetical protein